MESPSFCAQCGNRLQPRAKFCQGCGCQVENGIPPAAIPSTDVPPAPSIAQQHLPEQASKEEQIFAQIPPDKSSDQSEGAGPNDLLTNRIVFVFSYLLVATPTYILPYFGSNSALINGTSTAMGLGALPQFWYHLVALYILVVIAWLRGAHTGRGWIAIFPFLAGIFDMVPGLNWFFLIPTGFHVVTLIMGVKGDLVRVTNPGAPKQRLAISGAGLIALVLLSVFKTQSFFHTAEIGPSWERAPVKSSQSAPVPAPAQAPNAVTVSSTENIPVKAPVLPEAIDAFIRSHSFRLPDSIDKNCGFDFSTGANPFFIAGDFDGDGRTDYAIDVADKKQVRKLFVLLNNGTNYELAGSDYIHLVNSRGPTPTFDGPSVNLLYDSVGWAKCESSSGFYVYNKAKNTFDDFFTGD